MRLALAPVAPTARKAFARPGARPVAVPAAPPWRGFVIAALVLTVTIGALSGAFDLWRLRVAMSPVPVDHHRSHALGQLFGFLMLFTLGVSLHLGPRFFGAAPPSAFRVRSLKWLAVGGVVLSIAGRLGALLPGSALLGPVGAAVLCVGLGSWLALVVGWWFETPEHDVMQRFVLAGTAWWFIGGLSFLVWQWGQTVEGPLRSVPIEAVWAPALFGGGASWVWGVFLRAGLCTLQIDRPLESRQRAWFASWQAAAALLTVCAWAGPTWAWLGAAGMAVAVGVMAWALRFDRSRVPSPQGRAVRTGLWFVAVFGVLEAWVAASGWGVWSPPLLVDAARHCFSLGGATLMVFGFAGRMVPGFSNTMLAVPRVYEWGTWTVMAAAALRVMELVPVKLGLALAASSGGLAFAGVVMVATSLSLSLRRGERAGERG